MLLGYVTVTARGASTSEKLRSAKFCGTIIFTWGLRCVEFSLLGQ